MTMAALLYDRGVMPISTDLVAPRKTLINPFHHHDIVCGKTFDYYSSTTITGGFQVLTRNAYGAIKGAVLMHSPGMKRSGSIAHCVEFAGKPYILTTNSGFLVADATFSLYSGNRVLAECVKIGKKWTPSRTVECGDGNLYFSTHGGGDFSLPGLDTWRVLDFSIPEFSHTSSYMCASGATGMIYCIVGCNGGRTISARDPRTPTATQLDHDIMSISDVDGVVYAKVSGGNDIVAVCIYDERANALVGTTAIVDANVTGICRLNPKKYI